MQGINLVSSVTDELRKLFENSDSKFSTRLTHSYTTSEGPVSSSNTSEKTNKTYLGDFTNRTFIYHMPNEDNRYFLDNCLQKQKIKINLIHNII